MRRLRRRQTYALGYLSTRFDDAQVLRGAPLPLVSIMELGYERYHGR